MHPFKRLLSRCWARRSRMLNSSQIYSAGEQIWRMPIAPGDYDRRPLTPEEQQALAHFCETSLVAPDAKNSRSRASRAARLKLARFDLPLRDVFRLRHHGRSESA